MGVGRKWSWEEEIVVFNLYCKIPFKDSSKSHPDVIALANLIGRSPSSVNLKIGNFGSFDETLQKRGIVGLGHTSKLDKDVWDEFNGRWDELAYESEKILAKLKGDDNFATTEPRIVGYETERTVKQRVNQNFFRAAVLGAYNSVCCITGISTKQLLVASHIKPWKDSSENDKVNPRNGLCLNALHDKAFDRGLMTITTGGRIIISDDIRDAFDGKVTEAFFGIYKDKKMMMPEKFVPDKTFLQYHNDVIYENWR